MTNTYNGTNMGLEQNADGTWVFTNPAQTFIDPASFSTADPAFPTIDTTTDTTTEEDTTCEEGYIYDSTLKKCVPEVTGYEGQVAAYTQQDDKEDNEQNYVDFREMSYDEMIDFGKKEGYFNAAGTFIGAQKSTAYPFIRPLAQFGLDSQANRFAINFAKKGGKIWNPNEPSFIGNLYIPPPTTSGASVWADSMNTLLNVKDSVTTPVTTLTSAKDIGTYTGGVDYDDQSSPYDIQVNEEKVKQEKEKTEQQKIKTQQVKDEYKDKGQVTYSTKDTGGYVTTPNKQPSAPPGERGGGGYTKPESKKETKSESKKDTGYKPGGHHW